MKMLQLDHIHARMKDDLEEQSLVEEDSEIIKFYAGKTLFITGVTGYVGSCLVEKLLRSCPGIKRIYVLMRKKKNSSVAERLKKYFNQTIFDRLRQTRPDFAEIVTIMEGDLVLENLGLSQEDQITIKEHVNVMIHNGANVKFGIRVSLALRTNVLSTKYMIDLAEGCKKLDVFVYVSTAYSHCYKKVIEEEFYPPPADLKSVYKTIEADLELENGLSEEAIKELTGHYPNIYVYSKAIAEDMVNQCGQNNSFACCIFRPSIVLSAYREPVAGWCANTNGPVLAIVGILLGIVHVVYHKCLTIDMIPCDMTANALIAITRDCCNQRENEKKPLVYNFGSSTVNPWDLYRSYKIVTTNLSTESSQKNVWLPSCVFTSSLWVFWILHILFHMIPAAIVDVVLLVSGRKARVLSLCLKAGKHIDIIGYFGNGDWKIYIPRMLKVIDSLNTKDKEIFWCDLREMNWELYTNIFWRGARMYILKEKLDAEESYWKNIKLSILHYGFVTLIILVLFYFTLK